MFRYAERQKGHDNDDAYGLKFCYKSYNHGSSINSLYIVS